MMVKGWAACRVVHGDCMPPGRTQPADQTSRSKCDGADDSHAFHDFATHPTEDPKGICSHQESSNEQNWKSCSNELAHFILRRGWLQTIKMSGSKTQHPRLFNRFQATGPTTVSHHPIIFIHVWWDAEGVCPPPVLSFGRCKSAGVVLLGGDVSFKGLDETWPWSFGTCVSTNPWVQEK